MKKLVFAFFLGLLSASSRAASIAWSATPSGGYGFDQVSGNDLPVGSLVRVGTFSISDTVIQQNASNLSFLNSNFIEVGNTTIGTPGVGGNPGFFTASSTFTSTATLTGKQVYIWVFSSTNNSTPATSFTTATQIGIYYEPSGTNGQWAFASDIPTPQQTQVTVSDLILSQDTLRQEAKVVIGTFGPGTNALNGRKSFTLSNVPEPGSVALALAGGVTIMVRRRRS